MERRCTELGITQAQLTDRLAKRGRHSWAGRVSAMKTHRQKITVDDLVQLAAALEVSPATLLMPQTDTADDEVETVDGPRRAGQLWAWLTAEADLDGTNDRYRYRAQPAWVAYGGSEKESA